MINNAGPEAKALIKKRVAKIAVFQKGLPPNPAYKKAETV